MPADDVSVGGQPLADLSCVFESAEWDPISLVVAANGGKPFQTGSADRSALEILQGSFSSDRWKRDDTAMDAQNRDGNLLESFMPVVVVISSWAADGQLLSTITCHVGRKHNRSVCDILSSAVHNDGADDVAPLLESAMRNLLPLRYGTKPQYPSSFGNRWRPPNANQRG
eukprot:3749646-Rhodomonas_salina.1